MYAIVEISGKQFRVTKDMKLQVPLQKSEPGEKIGFDRVLLLEDEQGNTTFGEPLVKNTQVTATVLEHGRDKKVIVFKKKRRKGYQKKNGHRQGFSLIEINSIGAPAVKKAKATTQKAASEKDSPTAQKDVKKPGATSVKKTTEPKTKTASTPSASVKKDVKTAKTTTRTTKTTSKATKPAAKKETKEK